MCSYIVIQRLHRSLATNVLNREYKVILKKIKCILTDVLDQNSCTMTAHRSCQPTVQIAAGRQKAPATANMLAITPAIGRWHHWLDLVISTDTSTTPRNIICKYWMMCYKTVDNDNDNDKILLI